MFVTFDEFGNGPITINTNHIILFYRYQPNTDVIEINRTVIHTIVGKFIVTESYDEVRMMITNKIDKKGTH